MRRFSLDKLCQWSMSAVVPIQIGQLPYERNPMSGLYSVPPNAPATPGATVAESESELATGTDQAESTEESTESESTDSSETEVTRRQRKLRAEEKAMLSQFVLLANDPIDRIIPWSELTRDMKIAVLPSSKIKLVNKGLIELVHDIDTGAIQSVNIFLPVLDTYYDTSSKDVLLAELAEVPLTRPRARVEVGTDDWRKIRKQVQANPRRENTHAWYNWSLYRDDDSVTDYLRRLDYNRNIIIGGRAYFNGPSLVFLDQDIKHGFIKLYDARQPETLEDGSANPKYWLTSRNATNGQDMDAAPVEEDEVATTAAA